MHNTRFKAIGTIRHDTFDVMSKSEGSEVIGKLQAVYRGNYPSVYPQGDHTPMRIVGSTVSGKEGKLLAGLAAGMAYSLGGAFPVFSGLMPKPTGKSPSYDGVVEAKLKSQVEKLLGIGQKGAMAEDMIVRESCVFGNHMSGTDVQGWKLVEVGFVRASATICGVAMGGRRKPMRHVKTVGEAQEIVKVATDMMVGDKGTTFLLKFECVDLEKPVIKKGVTATGELDLWNGFNPPRRGFASQMEEVSCSCKAIRICGCGPSRTDEEVICKCPLYAREVGDNQVVPDAWSEVPPPNVIMERVPSAKFSPVQK